MKKKTISFGKSLLLFTLIFAFLSTLPLSSSALSLSPKTITDVRTEKYTPVPLYAGKTRLRTDGRIMAGTTFIPARVFFDTLYPGVQITYQKSNRTLTVTGKNLSVSMTDGSRVLYANGRVLYTDTPMVILSDGRLYAPVHLLSKVLSLNPVWSDATCSVTFYGTAKPLASGAEVYNEEDLYWLSRIISAEACGEPLLGQIAVGNVVLNRVASREFPSTVKTVVFDRKYGVQFSPILDGRIWEAPTASAVTAAKICLEGYSLSSTVLYFYAPKIVPNCWIAKNRPYRFTIGGHNFCD